MKRRSLISALAGLSAVLLTGCSLMEPVDISSFAQDAPGPDAKIIRLNNVYEPGHPANRCGAQAMKEELAKHGMDLKIYSSGQLGSEAETVEQVSTGALDVGMSTGAFFGMWYSDAQAVDGAYLFEDGREYDKATRRPVLAEVYDEMAEETGLRVFSSWYYGARNVTADKPIREPDDFRGLKIRTPDAPLFLQMIRAFGGTATPMALSEVYLGLQQGAIDAQENPIPTIATNRFEEVQSTISLTRHMVQGVQLVTSERFIEGLTEEERAAFFEAADLGRLANLECVEAEERETLEQWREDNAINIVEDIDRDAFRQRIVDQLIPSVPWGDVYLDIQEESEQGVPTVVGVDPENDPDFHDEQPEAALASDETEVAES